MSTEDQSPKTAAPASAAARDLVPYTPPPPKTIWDRAEEILASRWFRGGCLVAALAAGGIVGFVSIDYKKTQLAATQGREMNEFAAQIADIRQTIRAESEGRRGELGILRDGADKMQHSAAAALLKVSNEIDKANAARSAAETRLAERLDRLEKQKSDPAPTAAIPAAPAAPKAQLPTPSVASAGKELTTVSMTPPATIQRTDIPVRGYVLRAVENGVALVETRFGLREVQPGQTLPGAGRIQSIEKRGRKWVVVTSEGIIDSDLYR